MNNKLPNSNNSKLNDFEIFASTIVILPVMFAALFISGVQKPLIYGLFVTIGFYVITKLTGGKRRII